MAKACQDAFTNSSDTATDAEETLLARLQELQERQAEVTALLKGSRAVLKYRDFQGAARSIFDSCKELLGATSGYVALLDTEGTESEVLFLDSSPFGELAAIALQNSRTLESLQHSEERFRSLTQSASDGIVSTDSSGRIVYWNKAAEKMFGYSADEMVGNSLDSVLPDNIRVSHQQRIAHVASTGQSRLIGKTVEVTGLRRNGDECPIELSLATWKTGEGQFFTAILRDITERKQAQEVRRKLAHDLGQRVKELNCLYGLSKLVETPGITLDQILQGTVELIPSGWQWSEATSARLIFEGREFTTDNFQVTPWRQVAQIKVRGERSGSVEVYHDREMPERDEGPFLREERHVLDAISERLGKIIDRKQAENALQKANDLLEIEVQQRTSELRNKERSLAEAQRIAHVGNWDWDIPGNSLLWSDEVYRIFGLRPQEIAATYDTFLDYVHPDDRRHVERAVARALENSGSDYRIDHRVLRPDGTERIVREHGEVMRDRQGEPVLMIGTVHDITEQKKLEREILNISTEEQRRIGQELHDGLGQMLTGLNYLAKSLHQRLQAKDLPEADTAAELAEGIPQVVGQLQTIVKGLVPLEVDGEDLVPALYGLADNVREHTGVSCRFHGRGRVRVDDDNTAIQLYRIAQEAVNNAVKHGHAQQITVTLASDHNQIRLEVCDDGIGVGPDVDKALGSGLRIMRYRAGVIGGRFDIRRRTNGGTRVVCVLPMEKHDDRQ